MRQSRSEVTRGKIIDAAVEMFNDGGYSSTGLGDIVERTGMTKGALYHHFNSKEALAAAGELGSWQAASRRERAAFALSELVRLHLERVS